MTRLGYVMMKSYKAECPKCHHHSFYVTPSNGVGYCFRASCSYLERNGSNVIREKRRSDNVTEIRQRYYDLARYYHSCLDKKATKFLHSRGLTDKTIQERLLGYCPRGNNPFYNDEIAHEAGIAVSKEAFLADRVIFPYFKNSNTITDLRGRALDKDTELRYKSPYGGAYYRGAIYPYNYHIVKSARKVLLTEGEIKSEIAIQTGYPTMSIPGISSWRKGFIQDDDQQVVIVFDNERNPDTQLDVISAITRISKELIDPFIAVLPLYNENKAEIDTFIDKYGAGLFKSVIDNAIPYTTWLRLNEH